MKLGESIHPVSIPTIAIRRRVLAPAAGALTVSTVFGSGKTQLLAIQPKEKGVDLAEWAGFSQSYIREELMKYGALLFRGFGVSELSQFEQFAHAVCGELLKDNGEHSRSSLSDNVYTPVFYAPERKLLWHNENSFNYEWPGKILFCCLKAAREGGETPIVDSRAVFKMVPPEIRERFIQRQILYVRTYQEGMGLSWQAVFGTSDPAEVERLCETSHIQCEWMGPVLKTRCILPAAVKHPDTGEMSWFNQALHWHSCCLDPEIRRSLADSYGEDDLPRNCFYGDSSPIDDSDISRIREVYQELEFSYPWQVGNVMMLDNLSVAHARNAFAGERKLLVAMGDMRNYGNI